MDWDELMKHNYLNYDYKNYMQDPNEPQATGKNVKAS